MKIKFKKVLKLFIGLMSPLLVGLSVVPIITSCSKSEEGLIVSNDEGRLQCDEKYVQVVNGKNCIIVPYKYEMTRMYIQNTFTREHNITELYLPVGKYVMSNLVIDFEKSSNDASDYSPVNKIYWYDGFDKYANPKVVDPSNYKVNSLNLSIGSTYISTLGNLPKCNNLIINAQNSALVTLDLTGQKNNSLGSFKDSKYLRSIKIDKDAELSSIDDYWFYGCSINQPLILPKSIAKSYRGESIGPYAFGGKNNTFTDVYFYGDESDYKISKLAFNEGVRLHYNYEG